MIQIIIHYGLHFLLPLFIALKFYPKKIVVAYLIMIAGMLIDLDHFLANPVFDPGRCSIGFHPLHSFWVIIFYVLLLIPKKTRLIALGLVCHIFADVIDCLLM